MLFRKPISTTSKRTRALNQCPIAVREYGGDEGMLADISFGAIVADGRVGYDPSQQPPISLERADDVRELIDRGDLAEVVKASFGCSACVAYEQCGVRANLDRHRKIGEASKEMRGILEMIRKAPDWLAEVRSYQRQTTLLSDPDVEEISSSDVTGDYVDRYLKSARDNLFGSTNHELPPVSPSDIPEWSDLKIGSQSASVQGTLVESLDNGLELEVYDASELVGSKASDSLDADNRRILMNKFYALLLSEDELGRPQIMYPDSTQSKVLRSKLQGGTLCEVRMSGKNRLYFILGHDSEPMRVTILGGHGGDTNTQNKFIDDLFKQN